jgi:aminoglycoside phosphotransferase (APT) family kinase protein
VPEVLFVGEAVGRACVISRRADGVFLENMRTDQVDTGRETVGSLLRALRSCSFDAAYPEGGTSWHPHEVGPSSWRDWLRSGLRENPDSPVNGWREILAADPRLDALFVQCEQRIESLLGSCPERRDLIHGDLLHRNVLVSPDATEVTAVFSWKCSVLGDFLYDVAWLTFWSPWHPGIAALDVWAVVMSDSTLTKNDLHDAVIRHHCYESHIGATHLAYNAWANEPTELYRGAEEVERSLTETHR